MRRLDRNTVQKTCVLIHFWPAEGGFGKRMEMLMKVLQKKHIVERVKTPWAFLRILLDSKRRKNIRLAIIYTGFTAPLIIVLGVICPGIPVYYMVRGDEITYVKQDKRCFRAFVALVFQKVLALLRCHFVFVCEDLRILFQKRLGPLRKCFVLPNTLGKRLPEIRPFDGRLALIGDFNTVKNIEWAIENLSDGKFEVHLYGNHTLPEEWQRPWLHAHGVVENLTSALRESVSLIVLSYIDAGFPNVIIEAFEAACGVVVHRNFPFKYLPISEEWRFSMNLSYCNTYNSKAKNESELESVLDRLLHEKRDFKCDNPEFIQLIESDWEKSVWEIFG